MKQKRATTRDIAALAGVSQSTVSMILSGRENVSFSQDTVDRVLEAGSNLGYQPKRNTTKQKIAAPLIAVVAPTLANPYYSSLVQSIENEAAKQGFRLFICNTYRDPEMERTYLELLQDTKARGIIYTFMPYQKKKVKLLSLSIPIVIVSDKNEFVDLDTVELNSVQSGEIMAEYLLSLGHRRFALLSTSLKEDNMPRRRRLEGLRARIDAAGGRLTVLEAENQILENQYDINLEIKVGYELTAKALDSLDVTAYIGINDMVAYGILNAISDKGRQVPADYSVCGFDDIFPSGLKGVSLTTIDYFLEDKGRDAFDVLLRKLDAANTAVSSSIYKIEYKPKLIIRGSSGRCSQPEEPPAPMGL